MAAGKNQSRRKEGGVMNRIVILFLTIVTLVFPPGTAISQDTENDFIPELRLPEGFSFEPSDTVMVFSDFKYADANLDTVKNFGGYPPPNVHHVGPGRTITITMSWLTPHVTLKEFYGVTVSDDIRSEKESNAWWKEYSKIEQERDAKLTKLNAKIRKNFESREISNGESEHALDSLKLAYQALLSRVDDKYRTGTGATTTLFVRCTDLIGKIPKQQLESVVANHEEEVKTDSSRQAFSDSVNARWTAEQSFRREQNIAEARADSIDQIEQEAEERQGKIAAKLQAEQERQDLIAQYGELDAEKILGHQYWLGMTSTQLEKSLGKPDNINRTVTADGNWEQWAYYEMVAPDRRGQATTWGDILGLNKKAWSGRAKYFYFVEGVLTTFQDYK
jgi:hypothetical protein